MASIEIERELTSLELEQLLIWSILTEDNGHQILKYTYPALFSDRRHREVFKVIKILDGKADFVSVTKSSRENEKTMVEICTNEDTSLYRQQGYDTAFVVEQLRDLLLRREITNRVRNIVAHIEQADSETFRKEVIYETNKIYLLERKLTRKNKSSIEEIADNTARRVNSGEGSIQTGFDFINQRVRGLTRGSISTILAMPGHLKSTFSDALISTTVQTKKVKGLIISLEDPVEERVKRIMASRLNLSLKGMRFGTTKINSSDIQRVWRTQFHSGLTIYDVKDILTPEDAVAAINDVKPDLVVVDHVQKFEMPDMVIGIIKAVKLIETAAIRNNCHIIVTSQVNDKDFKFREKKNPTASDAQWTSVLRQSSAEMFGLYYKHQDSHNDFDKEYLDFEILKARYADATGMIKLLINPDRGEIIKELE